MLATRTNAVTEIKCESKELEEQFAQKLLALAKMESQEGDLCFKVKESDFLQLVCVLRFIFNGYSEDFSSKRIISNQFGMCGFQIIQRKTFFVPCLTAAKLFCCETPHDGGEEIRAAALSITDFR